MSKAIPHKGISQPGRREAIRARVIPAILVLYSCMLPRELTVEIATIAFQPYRIVLTLLLPYTIYLAGKERLQPSYIDLLIGIIAFWIVVALMITEGFDSAVVVGTSEALNMTLAYFTGRVALRTSSDVRSLIFAVLPGLLFCAVLIAIESFTHQQFVRPFAAKLLSNPLPIPAMEERMGLMRAAGPFPHPILAGVFMASFLPLTWYLTEKRPLLRVIGLMAVGSFFFSLSSTGFVGFIAAAGLMLANYAQKVSKLPVFAGATVAMLMMMVVISVFSKGGLFPWIVTHLTFDASTGYYRLSIWKFAGAEVKSNPIFGIGTRTYARPFWMRSASVDSYWLVLAMRYGIPASCGVFVMMVSAAVLSLRGTRSPYPLDQKVAYGFGFSLIAITFTGWSVYLWEGVAIWMILLTGMAVTFGLQMAKLPRSAVRSRPRARPRFSDQGRMQLSHKR